MKLLLDTQIIIWFVNDDPQLNDHLKDLTHIPHPPVSQSVISDF